MTITKESFIAKRLFRCKECNLPYKEVSLARKCEAWCKKHKSCNLELMKQSVTEEELEK